MNHDRGVPTVWWLGWWRAGEQLYWWTTAMPAEAGGGEIGRRQVRAAVQARVSPQTWAQTVDPAGRNGGPAGGPVDAAFVAAAAIAWDAVAPHLAVLAAAVPVQADPAVRDEAAALARRWRRVREIAALTPGSSAVGDDERAALLVEQIDLGLRSAALHRAAVINSLDRAWTGPLVDPDTNKHLCRDLGGLLLPAVLREYLADPTPATTVVIAGAPELGQVPWDLLTLDDDDTRLIERAMLRGGISPATLADLARPAAADRPDLPGLLAIDPAAGHGRDDPVPIYPDGLPDTWTTPERHAVIAGSGCTRGQLATLLQAQPWGRFVFHGHVSAGDALSPTSAALVLSPRTEHPEPPVTTDDGRALEEPGSTSRLSARVWLHDPQRWPMPRRVAFIACQADDAAYVEQTGLTVAAINAGARLVATTRWSLPTDATATQDDHQPGPTTCLATAVDTALRAPDPAAALRDWQLTELQAWRAATTPQNRRAHAPLLWASLVTYVLPDTLDVAPLNPVDP